MKSERIEKTRRKRREEKPLKGRYRKDGRERARGRAAKNGSSSWDGSAVSEDFVKVYVFLPMR